MTQPLWQPSKKNVEQTHLYHFMQEINQSHSLSLSSYSTLHQWSVTHSEHFWEDIWDYCQVIGSKGEGPYLVDGDKMPGAQWFPSAKLNFAENLLRFRDDHTALIFRNESNTRIEISYTELYARVTQCASGLKALNVKKGDVVAGLLPNIPDAVIAMLAATSLGAIWTSCSPDFGIQGVIDRFGQVKPKVLFTVSNYLYNGKVIDCRSKIEEISQQLENTEQIVFVPYLDEVPLPDNIPGACTLNHFLDQPKQTLTFEPMSFSDPLYIMYSSGTTGVPKCIVHGIGGTLLQHLKEHRLHTDIRREDNLFYFTTCGWMMWNWLISGLASGCSVVLFDGSPFAPSATTLWDMTEQEKISVFGTSAKYLSALEKAGTKPHETHQLDNLRAILSTGSPLSHESFEFVYRDIKQDLLLASISGGTDIISCFALGNPSLPVYTGELQCLGLGMDVAIYNDKGQSITREKGELVCQSPFPSMPIYFWNDADGEKYKKAYFSQFENIWAHGDYGEITEHTGMIIHGRSDAVLNPGGVRIGTAEIYRQVERISSVIDSVCIGQPWEDDTRVVLFVVLKDGVTLDDKLKKEIQQTIRAHTTPRHVPSIIIQVNEIPRTISGKIVELAIRKTVLGEEVTNKDALANPHALQYFSNLPELQCDE
ncbi:MULTISPECIES: acetoacetate--CoA ligase [unclassified Neptuniibacter]|uniref:acetoacetate--CoA ligase n=1 Tax=unclassified Neptuniibacter TaxID=2630693 RepID=UPI000C551A83|nr:MULTISPECIES: acetoacetate--CoA ligase [unclassified Neptuniibacter]MAY43020.1 acetoacetate--CoA ligase [Oceanospirillaceae bacterium]|tara:strand:- start:3061 stop:5016 length:1956 start_codon:yes stop_codon:yes gene_type:complete